MREESGFTGKFWTRTLSWVGLEQFTGNFWKCRKSFLEKFETRKRVGLSCGEILAHHSPDWAKPGCRLLGSLSSGSSPSTSPLASNFSVTSAFLALPVECSAQCASVQNALPALWTVHCASVDLWICASVQWLIGEYWCCGNFLQLANLILVERPPPCIVHSSSFPPPYHHYPALVVWPPLFRCATISRRTLRHWLTLTKFLNFIFEIEAQTATGPLGQLAPHSTDPQSTDPTFLKYTLAIAVLISIHELCEC